MTLLEILRREVTGQDGTEKMELSVAGLNAVMRLAREHAVTGLVANAAMRNRIVIAGGAAEGRGEAVMRLMQQTMAHRQNQRRFEDAVGRFARLMEENSIAYVVFKGLAVARYYPEPFVRTMGDVDFYVPQMDFLRAVEVIERGLHVVMDKEDVDKHYSFDWQGIRFEMHYQIETFGSHRHQHRFDRMIDEAMAEHTDSFTVCDSDGNIGYMKAFRAMLAMMRRYLGLDWFDNFFVYNRCDERYANKLMAAVMESGNFGRKAYRNHTTGKKKSMETATRALRHCVKFFWLAPKDIICLIPRRIGITLKQKF